MTKNQGKKVGMYSLIILFFAKFDGDVNGFQPLVDQLALFVLKEKGIRVLLDEQGYGNKGYTMSKAALRQQMIGLIMPMVDNACAWALTVGNADMQDVFGIVETDFKLTQDKLIILVDEILEALTDNVLALAAYNITLLKINAAKTAEANYIAAKEIPKQKRATKKTVTASISKEIKGADKILTIIDRLMSGEFGGSMPNMVLEYTNSRMIHNSVNRHTMVKLHVYRDEDHTEPIAHATISIVSIDRHDETNVDGEGEIIQFKGGDYLILVKAKGFGDAEIPFSIKRGKQIAIDVVMEANVVFGNIVIGGKPAVNANVHIEGTNITKKIDAFGDYELHEVPEGMVVIEASNEKGDRMSKTIVVENGKRLRVDMVI